ncbi:hypothetical protein [Streptomyces sp. ST2-7A]|uniref:hypothetical protein n=1 Tax=Streptomyces sp. ST2-7A TaxID=2907214 RepID=UPI001F27AA3B|nr:hypothetical protein [Streptomyces sp. ST2-7A]MCE7082171.1 hypothetical protein [Streptomyces sp. ST2-7A]
MRAVEVAGRVTGRDLWDGMRARRGMRALRWGLAVVLVIAGGCVVAAWLLPDREWARYAGLLGAGPLIGGVMGWAADRLRLRRLDARAAARGECRVRIHDAGIEAGDALSTFTTGWEAFPTGRRRGAVSCCSAPGGSPRP